MRKNKISSSKSSGSREDQVLALDRPARLAHVNRLVHDVEREVIDGAAGDFRHVERRRSIQVLSYDFVLSVDEEQNSKQRVDGDQRGLQVLRGDDPTEGTIKARHFDQPALLIRPVNILRNPIDGDAAQPVVVIQVEVLRRRQDRLAGAAVFLDPQNLAALVVGDVNEVVVGVDVEGARGPCRSPSSFLSVRSRASRSEHRRCRCTCWSPSDLSCNRSRTCRRS